MDKVLLDVYKKSESFDIQILVKHIKEIENENEMLSKACNQSMDLNKKYNNVEVENQRLKEAYAIVFDWIKRRNAPNRLYKYSRCIACDYTWWENEEEHNRDCIILKAKKALGG